MSITFRRGTMTVDDYLGGVSRSRSNSTPPAPEIAAAFNEAVERALALARARVAANPGDAAAHYELGAAVGLRASYIATVEASNMRAFKVARGAYDEHEQVLKLDASRKDAGLIVGTYRYIVATLSLPLRFMAYVAGFGSGRDQGLQLVEGAASYPGENQADARFALLVLYNREHRYSDALAQLAMLRERYPRNRMMWLESGSTNLRAGKPADAERFLSEGIGRLASDTRPRMFGEDALWSYKRGSARAALGRDADFGKAPPATHALVRGRSHLSSPGWTSRPQSRVSHRTFADGCGLRAIMTGRPSTKDLQTTTPRFLTTEIRDGERHRPGSGWSSWASSSWRALLVGGVLIRPHRTRREVTAEQEFARQRFAGQQPLIELRKTVQRRMRWPSSTAGSARGGTDLQTIRVV
jgi:hypothetical protein